MLKIIMNWLAGFRSSQSSQATRRYEIGGVLFEQRSPTVDQAEMVRQVMFEAAASTDEITSLEAAFMLLGAKRIKEICGILLSRPGDSLDKYVRYIPSYLTDKIAWEIIFHFFVQSPASAKMIGTAIGRKIRTDTKDHTPDLANAN
jgi:hypothetical protein